MKESMKHIILAVTILCGTAQAAIHGVPNDSATCAMVGAISAAAFTYQREGVSREQTVRAIESRIKSAIPKTGSPPWARKVIEASWDATEKVPEATPEIAEAVMILRCMEK